jgi:hypothetical protein
MIARSVVMTTLIIELERISVPQDFLGALREEFEAGGMTSGRLAVGDVSAEPGMAYLLWHDTGEVPVSMLAERASFEDDAGTRGAARTFLAKWKRRLH